jgi:hypothetical protein
MVAWAKQKPTGRTVLPATDALLPALPVGLPHDLNDGGSALRLMLKT